MDPLSIPEYFLPLVINAVVLLITLLYGCWQDIKERAVPVVMWYPMLIIAGPSIIYFWYTSLTEGYFQNLIPFIPLIVFFCIAFYLFTYFNLFGMGDAKALIWITLLVPLFPVVPIFGYSMLGFEPFVFLPFSVLINAVIINLILPVGFFIYNLIKRNKAPFRYMFLGYPVDGKKIEDSFGIVMEDIKLSNGKLIRNFIPVGYAIKDLVSGGRRIYTKSLKEEPEKYKEELNAYRNAGQVWISYGVPFLIPITLGLITAIIIGDFFAIISGAFL